MYLPAHHEILSEALDALPPDFLEGWPGLDAAAVAAALRLGVSYPDLPCGNVVVVDGRAEMPRPRLCSVLAFTRLAGRKFQHDEIYQSHLGSYAYLHAMTPDPAATVGEVTRQLVDHLVALAWLAWKGASSAPSSSGSNSSSSSGSTSTLNSTSRGAPYPMWLGIALHTLMDSYSESHAIRHRGRRLLRSSDAGSPEDAEKREAAEVRWHARLLSELAERTVNAPLPPPAITAALKAAGVPAIRRRSASKSYRIFLFHQQARRDARQVLPGLDALLERSVGHAVGRSAPHDLITYSHYQSQPLGYHSLGDRVSLVRDNPRLYARMLGECVELMRTFRAGLAFDGKSKKTSKNKNDPACRAFLRRVLALLLDGAFRMTPGRAAGPTGLDYAAIEDTPVERGIRPYVATVAGITRWAT